MTVKLPPGITWGDGDDDDVLSTSTFVKPQPHPEDVTFEGDDASK